MNENSTRSIDKKTQNIRRRFAEDLQGGFANFMHQMMYPEMTADYYEQMSHRIMTDPLLRARVDSLVAGVMTVADTHRLFDE